MQSSNEKDWEIHFATVALNATAGRRARAKRYLEKLFRTVVVDSDPIEVCIAKVRGLARAIDQIELWIKSVKIKKYKKIKIQ